MSQKREVASDPRTIARDISGIFDATFPQLAPAIVAHFNRAYRRAVQAGVPIDSGTMERSGLQRAMLFELAIAVAEDRLLRPGADVDWDRCLARAASKQRKFFDAEIPSSINTVDRQIAEQVAFNLLAGIKEISDYEGQPVVVAPQVPGFRWIATGEGDFATEGTIIEVKCSSKRFSTADYRQIVIYWLLKHIYSREFGGPSWQNGVLINPRLCILIEFPFNDLVELIALEKSISSMVDMFCSIVSEFTEVAHGDNQFEVESWPNA